MRRMEESKKKVAQEVPVQEQPKYTNKDLETIALKIVILLHDKHISTLYAKEILENCNRLIDLNSEIVINNGDVKVPLLSHLSE